jgi:hypothetical protein
MKKFLVLALAALAACGGTRAVSAAAPAATAKPDITCPSDQMHTVEGDLTSPCMTRPFAPPTTSTVPPTTLPPTTTVPPTTVSPTTTVPPTTTTDAPKLGSKENPIDGEATDSTYCTQPSKPCGDWTKLQIDGPVTQGLARKIRKGSPDNPVAQPGQHWVEIGFIATGSTYNTDPLAAETTFDLVGDKGTIYESQQIDDSGITADADFLGAHMKGEGGPFGMTFGNLFFLVDDDDSNLLMVRCDLTNDTIPKPIPVQYIKPHSDS